MHHFVGPCFHKFFFMRNHPCLTHIVHKHKSQRANHFKVFKVLIKRTLTWTINQTPPSLHHIISCILLSNHSFSLCLRILVNVEPTQQVCSIREYSFHCIHQRQIFVGDNNPGECINSHEKIPKPL